MESYRPADTPYPRQPVVDNVGRLSLGEALRLRRADPPFQKPSTWESLITGSRQVEDRVAVTGDGVGGHSYSSRNSRVREVYPDPSTDWIFRKLEAAVLQLNNQQYRFELTGFFEGAQVYEYPVGGFLNWHMDVAKGYMSNRKLSMSVQLSDSDDYEGGDLAFMDYKETAPRGIGDLIVFPSYLQHRVTELNRGVRYAWVSWVHGPAYR